MEEAKPNPSTFGFKPMEWVILGVIVVTLFAFVVPRFVKARREAMTKQCITHLKMLDSASNKWALEHKRTATAPYSLTDTNYLAFLRGSVLPICPAGGRYTAGTNVGDTPKCNIPGHMFRAHER